jgi:alkylation response protein AidB-like acyl-CoA dehydrogenase
MCFALVRTDNTKKHEGISFVFIDMKDPGVEVRPIKLISGNSPFCETFFTDVKVPKENLMGPLNGGWTVGKRLLQHQSQAEVYVLQGSLPAAIEQLQLARSAGDGDFYQLSVVDARLKELRSQHATEMRDAKR